MSAMASFYFSKKNLDWKIYLEISGQFGKYRKEMSTFGEIICLNNIFII